MGWGSLLHGMALASPPALTEGIRIEASFPDRHQLAHQQPHHSVEKAAGLQFGHHQISLATNLHGLNGGPGMGAAAAGALEGGKIMLSH